ncbi:MAG: DUF2628 domain-containing protein [Burkholderia sp.]
MSKRIEFKHPARADWVSVPTGFSWPALLLGGFWALAKKLWLVALTMLVVEFALGFIGEVPGAIGWIATGLSIVFSIYCGWRANAWHCRTLERRGWVRQEPAAPSPASSI